MASDDDQSRRIALQGLLLIAAALLLPVVVVYAIGPSYCLTQVLKLLPEHPGRSWFLGWGLFLFIAAVLAVPLWPAICVLSGFMFGLGPGTSLNFLALFAAAALGAVLGKTWPLADPESSVFTRRVRRV